MEEKSNSTKNNTPDPTSRIILIFGSNQGNRAANLHRAAALATTIGNEERRSSLYESDPWGFHADTPFYNRVISYRTTLSPTDILDRCQEIEQQMGRQRHPTTRYTSRPIDVDILLHDNLVIDTPRLTIPHPRLAQRRFVLLPLAEIFPKLLHPTLRATIAHLLETCTDTGRVTKIEETP
jgi:2-amino-4-hydroxy-6-hydroxymethyldihydropteridine diphosphokinase